MIIGIYGYQDSGKTVTVEKLASALVKNGYRVASVKHSPHRKSVDCEGKDTWRHWKAGSDPVAFSSETETAVIKHSKMGAEEIASMIKAEFEPDVIIIEGFKEGSFPKVAIGSVAPRKGTVMVNPKPKELVEFVEKEVEVERTLSRLPCLDCGKCGLDCEGLARAIVEGKRKVADCAEQSDIRVDIRVDGRSVPTGRFVSNIVDSTIRGMLGSLKGFEAGGTVEIRLEGKKRSLKKLHRK
jgi:molybdopterin-guanine dinucleotide biosynthesis protein B